MNWNLFKTELFKIFAKPRSYIGFIAIAVIVGLIQVAMYSDGEMYLEFFTNSLQQTFNVSGKLLTGNLITSIILQTLVIQIPLLVALVTGDLISGESAMGTIRLLASKPISRTSIVLSKFAAGSVYTFLLLLFLALVSLGIGLLVFGGGDLIMVKSEEIVILQGDDTLWRFMCALLIAFFSMLVIAAFSLCLSCYAENSIGPIITTMAVIILFTIIGTMDIPLFDKIKPFLFTTHMVIWRNFFDNPLPVEQIKISVSVLVLHTLLFLTIAVWRFNKKDILS